MKRMTVILMLAGSIVTVATLQANGQAPDPALLAPGSSLTPQIEPPATHFPPPSGAVQSPIGSTLNPFHLGPGPRAPSSRMSHSMR
jgi:hypothetical protein